MKTRLAESCFERDYGIDVKLKQDFLSSKLHGHDFYELDIILSGENTGSLNRENISISGGDIFFLTPEDFHEYGDSGRLNILNVHFSEDSISPEILGRLLDSEKRHFKIGREDFHTIEKLSYLLSDLYSNDKDVDIVSRILESILLLMLRDSTDTHAYSKDSSGDIRKAIIYLGAHFRENPSLSEVASTIPLNERYFCLKFKEYTGENYKEYLKKMKLRYARRLILSTSYSMLEIAEKSGYMTQSHFNREFKEKYGVTPTSLRKL